MQGTHTARMLARARRDQSDKRWLEEMQASSRAERRRMEFLAVLLAIWFAVLMGAVFADWMTGEHWIARIVVALRGAV